MFAQAVMILPDTGNRTCTQHAQNSPPPTPQPLIYSALAALPWQPAVFWSVLVQGTCVRGQMNPHVGPSAASAAT